MRKLVIFALFLIVDHTLLMSTICPLDDVEDGDLVHTDDDTVREDVAYLIVRCHWKAGVYHQELVFPSEFSY